MKINIGNNSYIIRENWTLREAIKITELKIPESLRELYDSILLNDKLKSYKELHKKLTSEQLYKEHPKYYGEIIKIISDIPDEVIEIIDPLSRIEYFTDYIEPQFLDVYFATPNNYQCQDIESFEFKGETYYFPESLKLFDKHIPAYKETALSFTEASDLMTKVHNLKNNGISAMAEIIAVYCRKKNEAYSEQLVIERSELFKDLPLEIIWEVFFA